VQLLFQGPNLPRQDRLSQVQSLSSAPEVQLFGHGDEVAQFAQIQIHATSHEQ
jgi:hypothetical protein